MAAAERSEVVDVPLSKLYQAVCDFAAYPQFVSGIKAVKLVGEEGDAKIVHFDVEMMKHVTYTLAIKNEIDSEQRQAKVYWNLKESPFFKVSNGLWELKNLGPSKTQVLYKLEIDFDFPVPGFVLKKLVASALPKTIAEFVEKAKKL